MNVVHCLVRAQAEILHLLREVIGLPRVIQGEPHIHGSAEVVTPIFRNHVQPQTTRLNFSRAT